LRHAGGEALARCIGDHLRALLRDVICGHLDTDLVGLADGILIEAHRGREADVEEERSAEQMLGDLREPEEILDLFI
jgi:hypothetical protein